MTQLHDLLDEAAESYVPDGLARRAVADAGRRRRQRFTVAAAVASVAAVVLAFVVVVEPFTSSSPELIAPASAAPFPAQLPSAQDLPSLADAPMGAASAAYVVDGEVVLVNAATAEAVTAFASEGDIPPSLSGASIDVFAETPNWSAVSLSPDGGSLLMTFARTSDTIPASSSLLFLLDVPSGEVTRLSNVGVADDQGMALGWFEPQILAWSPTSTEFACVCSVDPMGIGAPQLHTFRVSDITEDGQAEPFGGPHFTPEQIAWGKAGLFVQFDHKHWFLDNQGSIDEAAVADTDLLAPSTSDPAEFGFVRNFFPESESDTSPLASGPAWTIDIDTGGTDSLPDRPAFRGGTAVAATSVIGGYLVVVRPRDAEPGEPPPPTVLDVAFVDAGGNQTSLTQLPLGTSSSSFAATLVSSS